MFTAGNNNSNNKRNNMSDDDNDDDDDYVKKNNKQQKTTATAINYAGKSSLSMSLSSEAVAASSTEEGSVGVDDVVTLEDIMLVLKNNQKELINIKKELTTAKEELKKEATTSKEIITKKFQDEMKSLKDQYLSDKEKEYVNADRICRFLKDELAAGKEFITKKFQDEVDSLKQQLLLLKEEKVNNNDDYDDDDDDDDDEEDGSSVGTVIDLEDEAADGIYYKKWKTYYRLLEKYVDDNDGKIPTRRCVAYGITLGDWVQKQRYLYNFYRNHPGQRCCSGTMSNRRKDDLEKIESWTWYLKKNGKKDNGSIEDDDEAEAEVVVEEEEDGSVGTVINLEDEAADGNYYKKWEKNYKLLKKYVDDNDGKIPTFGCEVDGIKLGNWVHNQRRIYIFLKSNPGKACRNGKMTKRRKDDLERIESWTWKVYEKE